MKTRIHFVLSLFLLASCQSGRSDAGTTLHFESIEQAEPVVEKQLEEFVPRKSELFLGNPAFLRMVADSLLLIADKYDDKTVTLYNLRTDRRVGRYLAIGNGPGEVFFPLHLEYANDSIYYLERQTSLGRALAIRFEDLLKNRVSAYRAFRLPEALSVAITDRGFLTTGAYEGAHTVRETGFGGDSLPVNLTFCPEFAAHLTDFDRWLSIQAEIVCRGNRYMFTRSMLGEIEFYGRDDEGFRLLRSCSIGDTERFRERAAQGIARITNSDKHYFEYKGAAAGPDAFYVLCNNYQLSEEGKKGSVLLKFSLDGEFIERIHLDRWITAFTIASDNTLYAVTCDDSGNPILVRVHL